MVIGITGTQGAGKGTVSAYIVEKYGAEHFSVSELIKEYVVASGREVNRDSMRVVANDIRRERGAAFFIKELYTRAQDCGGVSIVESIRTIGEIDFLEQQEDFILLAVDADQAQRYAHIQERGSAKDNVDFATFVAQETAEAASDDPSAQNIMGVVARAAHVITNDGTLEELYAQVDAIMESLT